MNKAKKLTKEQSAVLTNTILDVIRVELRGSGVVGSRDVVSVVLSSLLRMRLPEDFWTNTKLLRSLVLAAVKAQTADAARRRLREKMRRVRTRLKVGLKLTSSLPVRSNVRLSIGAIAAHAEDIELYVEPGSGSAEEVRAVLRALNELHVASGGLGLEFHTDGTFVLARQEAHA